MIIVYTYSSGFFRDSCYIHILIHSLNDKKISINSEQWDSEVCSHPGERLMVPPLETPKVDC